MFEERIGHWYVLSVAIRAHRVGLVNFSLEGAGMIALAILRPKTVKSITKMKIDLFGAKWRASVT